MTGNGIWNSPISHMLHFAYSTYSRLKANGPLLDYGDGLW